MNKEILMIVVLIIYTFLVSMSLYFYSLFMYIRLIVLVVAAVFPLGTMKSD